MADNTRVAVLGACGKMGREVVKAVCGAPDMELVGACDVVDVGSDMGGVVVVSDVDAMLEETQPDVLVDFAKPFEMKHVRAAMDRGVVPIVGTTGQTNEQLEEIEALARDKGVGAMVIPNFAVGAVLMMRFACEAARYMPCAEIIELHHDKKADAPSGTAIKTAEMLNQARKDAGVKGVEPAGGDAPSRGEVRSEVRIHSVRLPGLVAHQEVLFGGTGQVLTIRHDSIDRTSFMPGVLLAVRRASEIEGLIYGLDKLL